MHKTVFVYFALFVLTIGLYASEVIYTGSKGGTTISNLYQSLEFSQKFDDEYLFPMAKDFANTLAASNTLGFPGAQSGIGEFPSLSAGFSFGGSALPMKKILISAKEGQQEMTQVSGAISPAIHFAMGLSAKYKTALVGKIFYLKLTETGLLSPLKPTWIKPKYQKPSLLCLPRVLW
ncbi:MAG: hypothetical protein D6767_04930 [Candidatus Hydrogenedentota bacterium]|nr:MAG: hypothetical protein D6767_04930 [Candidatus Hydrogenedentota bacterium]